MINVTPAAASKITELLTEENKLEAGLRVFVQGGGCSGFQYGLMIDEGEGDATTDAVIESNGVKLLIDPISARYLSGAEVDFVVNVFLRQQGHLTADDLVDLIGREDQRISRATIYRTLQWMVDAGIARKVDFGEGRFRFEHSYRHPRHFHLICKTCNQTFEFLSSDIEALLEEVAAARNFTPRQSVLQIHGTCETCRTGRPAAAEGGTTELLFARDALRIAIATERSGLEFYSRASRMTKDQRGRRVFEKLAREEKEHLSKLE